MTWHDLNPDIRDELNHRLTRKQRDILILSLAGCGYTRIARMLNIAPSTVRTHLNRARQIHEQLNNENAT